MKIDSKLFEFTNLVNAGSGDQEHKAALDNVNDWIATCQSEKRSVEIITIQTVSDRHGCHYGIRVYFKVLPKPILREQHFAKDLAGLGVSEPARLQVIPNTNEGYNQFRSAGEGSGNSATGVKITPELLVALQEGKCIAIDDGESSTMIILSQVEMY